MTRENDTDEWWSVESTTLSLEGTCLVRTAPSDDGLFCSTQTKF
jgi:hypothetical protein